MLACTVTAFGNTVPSDHPSMVGGTPTVPHINELDDAHVCLIQDMASFWGNSNVDILNSMAPTVTYDLITSAMIPATDFTAYTFVLVEGNQPATFNTNVLANMAQFESYVNGGGLLQFHMGTNTHTPAMVLWDGTTYVYADNDTQNWMGPDGAGHPALAGVAEPYEGNASNHGYLSGGAIPTAAIIVETTVGNPTYAEYTHGAGNVIVTTMTMEYLWEYGYNSGQILWNTIDYLANFGPPPPVTLNLTPVVDGVPDAGGTIVYDAHLVSNIGMAMANLRYQTFVTLPNGQVMGPIDNIPWNLTPFMDVTVTGMTLDIPGYAPSGLYDFEGIAGVPNNPAMQVSDSFPFTKAPPVGDGLFEDFEDGIAQGFDFFVGDIGTWSVDGGFAKLNVWSETDDWGSGHYTGDTFASFSLSSTSQMVQTIGNSVGVIFCTDGANDGTMNGYAVYLSNGHYSAWNYVAGGPGNLIGWTIDGAIMQGAGAINVLEIDGGGGNFDITCNGTYLGSFFDATYPTGFVGFTCAYNNETWYDVISGTHVPGADAFIPGEFNMPDPVLRDHMGNVITDASEFYTPGVAIDRSAEIQAEFESGWYGTNHFLAGEEASVVALPSDFAMNAAYPNPFNPSTSVAIALPQASDLTVTVFNVMGQQVAELANGKFNAGQHTFTFDASNLSSGLYFIQAQVPGQMSTIQKVTLMK